MTSPSPQPDLRSTIDAHDVAAAALEVEAVAATAGLLRRQVDAALSAFLAQWRATFPDLRTRRSGPEFDRVTRALAAKLHAVTFDPAPALLEYTAKARALGVAQGFVEAGEPPAPMPTRIDFSTRTQISHAVADAKQKLAVARTLAHTVDSGSFHTVQAAVAPATQAANGVARTAATLTNTELNAGITDVADRLGAQRVWVAERNACVVCLSLSGHVVDVGQAFDLDATFGTKSMAYVPISAGGLTGPPRHPWCRCRSTIWRGANDDSVIDFPTALRREAERSILTGQALPTESEHVRTQAADRLLRLVSNGTSPSGWQVPKSVRAKANAAVDRGTFNRK